MPEVNLVIDLDLENIGKGVRKVNMLPNQITDAILDGILETVEKMEDKGIEELSNYGLGGSNLATSFKIIPEVDSIRLINDAPYADYVEYGTGIVGQGDPHPEAGMAGWAYNIGDKIDPVTNTWKYFNPNLQRVIRTKGQPSKPYMYNTYKYGVSIIQPIVRKYIKGIKV